MSAELKTPFRFSAEREKEIEALRRRYETPEGLIMPLLWMVQYDHDWISPEAMVAIAGKCDTSPAWVYSLATFYTMFELERPVKYQVQVCRNLSCALSGSDSILEYLEKKLGIRAGDVTADGKYRLTGVECLASCGTGPMMQINTTYYENLTPEKVDAVLEELDRD